VAIKFLAAFIGNFLIAVLVPAFAPHIGEAMDDEVVAFTY
jgi:hypothetical protein